MYKPRTVRNEIMDGWKNDHARDRIMKDIEGTISGRSEIWFNKGWVDVVMHLVIKIINC
jgi:hypothetical protein